MDFDNPKVYGDTSITDGLVIHHMVISVVSGSGGKDSIVKTIGRVIYCTEEAILQKHRNISMFLSWEILPKKRNRGKDASLQGPLIITNISRFLS